jgi:adenosylcobinamide-GDP ribazoletransferase
VNVSDVTPESWPRRELRALLTAVQYFTRVPVPVWVGHSPRQLSMATRYFPLVGLAVGAAGALALALSALGFNALIAVLLSTAVTICLTGAFHEDGLADTFDSLGALARDRALEIMKDSRIGTFGALALLMTIGLKIGALAALPYRYAALVLIAGHALSRACAVALAWRMKYVRLDNSARAKPVMEDLRGADVSIACACGLAPLPFAGIPAVLGLGGAVLALLALRRFVNRRFGGYTGDTLGATQQICEVTFYLVVVAAWKLY